MRVSFSRSKCCSHWVRMETDSTPRGLQPRRGPEGKGAVAHATTSGGARRSTSSRRACMPWQARLLAGMLGQQASQTSRQLRSRPRLTAAAPAAAWAPSARRCRTVTDRQRLWPLSAPAQSARGSSRVAGWATAHVHVAAVVAWSEAIALMQTGMSADKQCAAWLTSHRLHLEHKLLGPPAAAAAIAPGAALLVQRGCLRRSAQGAGRGQQ